MLLCLKLWSWPTFRFTPSYPDKITLLRGNHETREITRIYGFYCEISHKYKSPDPWTWFTEVFDYLGVAAVSFFPPPLSHSSSTTAFSASTGVFLPPSTQSTKYEKPPISVIPRFAPSPAPRKSPPPARSPTWSGRTPTTWTASANLPAARASCSARAR